MRPQNFAGARQKRCVTGPLLIGTIALTESFSSHACFYCSGSAGIVELFGQHITNLNRLSILKLHLEQYLIIARHCPS